jgi:hypothetical protein
MAARYAGDAASLAGLPIGVGARVFTEARRRIGLTRFALTRFALTCFGDRRLEAGGIAALSPVWRCRLLAASLRDFHERERANERAS